MRRAVYAVLVLGLLAALVLVAPWRQTRRVRGPDWNQPWAGVALTPEREWATDATRRRVVQVSFLSATPALTRCLQEYAVPEGQVLTLHLWVETEPRGTHVEYADVVPGASLPAGFDQCLMRALELAGPVATPEVPVGTRWRLTVDFLVPPASSLPRVPWWKKLVPESWDTPAHSGTYVG